MSEEEKENRGGRREGSGRKTKWKGQKVVTVAFCCAPEQKARLDEKAKEKGMTRSDFIVQKLFEGEENENVSVDNK